MKRRKFVTGTAGAAATVFGGRPRASAYKGAGGGNPANTRRRVLFLAVDAMDPAAVQRFRDELPNIRRVMGEGYSGRILPYVSCWGNMDFMSMMTGAPPGTQYRSRPPGGGSLRHRGCVSETIWQVLAGDRRRSLLLEFPGAIPEENVATIPGRRGGLTLERAAVYQTRNVVIPGTYNEQLETTGWPPGGGPKPGRQPVVIDDPRPATGWGSLPQSARPPLEIRLERWPALILASGSAYDTVAIYQRKGGPVLARTSAGGWSDWGEIARNGRRGLVRFRLLELAPDGSRLQLLRSAVCATDDFSEPPGLARHLAGKLGPIWSGSAIPPNPNDPFWEAGEAEALEGTMRIAGAALETLESWDWDFFLHKTGLVDKALHQCLTLADPSYYRYDAALGKRADAVYRRAYMGLDQVIGKLLGALEQRGDTVLVVAGDHGGGVNNVVCDIDQRLRDAGLLAGAGRDIDWSRTRAYTKRQRQGTEIFINLKGREPQGIVDPADYEKTQEAVIDALLDWRSPLDGRRAVTYALKLRDAALIGYWGPEAGDVQFCYNPGFVWGVNPDGAAIAPARSPVSNHGPQIVTGETGYSSMMGQMLAWGPGVARGVQRDETALGPIPIASVAPTVSRLLGCRAPAGCQLGPILEMLA